MSMNAQDLCSIQECLIGYKKLIDWLPIPATDVEQELRANRVDVINHLMNICGAELTRLSEEYRNE